MTRYLTQYQNPISFLLRLFLGIIVPLLIFGKVAEDILEKERFAFETPFLLGLHAHATPALDKLALFFTNIGGATVIAPISAVLLAILWFKDKTFAYFFGIAVAGAAIMNVLLKMVFHRARPELWPRLVNESDASFPSGHSMYSAAFVSALIVLLWHTKWRYPALILGVLFTLCVGVSRLYLGVHFPTDVLCGWLAGLAWVMGTRTLMPQLSQHFQDKRLQNKHLQEQSHQIASVQEQSGAE